VRTDRFDYDLPPAAIAQQPAARRDAARLLVDRGPGSTPDHRTVADLADLLAPGDLLVVNSTRVLPARLHLRKDTGGLAEVLLIAPVGGDGSVWRAMVRPARRLAPGTRLVPVTPPADTTLATAAVEVGEDAGGGQRIVRLTGVDDPQQFITSVGEVPLPPYITAPVADPDRYQTVFADRAASVAAPTAGLHLTDELLGRCVGRGVAVVSVELDIGPGTFVPVTAEEVEDHRMHAERYRVPPDVLEAVADVRRRGGAVVAVGTTVVRTLESWASTGATEGETDLFITPGFAFTVVDQLMTNFHQPRSTLLVLLESFMGPRWRELYADALDQGYRFLSFGDAMLVDRRG